MCGNSILPAAIDYVCFYMKLNLRNLLYVIRNGGDLLELVRCQWQEAAAAVGAETEKIYLSSQIIASEKNRWGDIGKYYEAMRCTFAAPESRKQATILYHEWF